MNTNPEQKRTPRRRRSKRTIDYRAKHITGKILDHHPLSKAEAEDIINRVFLAIEEALLAGKVVYLPRIGWLRVAKFKGSRAGRINVPDWLKTNKEIPPFRLVPKFKASVLFKESINENKETLLKLVDNRILTRTSTKSEVVEGSEDPISTVNSDDA